MKKHYTNINKCTNLQLPISQQLRRHVSKKRRMLFPLMAIFLFIQLVVFIRTMFLFFKVHDKLLPTVHQHQQQWQWIGNKNRTTANTLSPPRRGPITTIKASTSIATSSCFPPQNDQMNVGHHTIIYLELAWFDEHSETIYSYIREICSCDKEKDQLWTVDAIPHFYIGPEGFLGPGFQRILREFNTTTCGPIFFGKPEDPNITIVTTSYQHNFMDNETEIQYRALINDTRYIFICHDDHPSLEYAENIFFLTPSHKRYIVPSYFPPSLVPPAPRSKSTIIDQPPIFLVLGSFHVGDGHRNIRSLAYPLEKYRDFSFRIRFLGGRHSGATNEEQIQGLHDIFPNDTNKFEFFLRPDIEEFMKRVAESDVILPLVDGDQFKGFYQNGKRLTSSMIWGLGFHKQMILNRQLAELFGIQEDNVTYFLHDDSPIGFSSFSDAFGRCLSQYWNVLSAEDK
ncbi:hypothetical protein ACHAWU_008667 [Discostella pseudostelligera]|uniref:Uncharacterized protein n=1 Tax=Discostella pseudostelligera TaxID=259834 RepID=A0ABD3M5P8_9STRA